MLKKKWFIYEKDLIIVKFLNLVKREINIFIFIMGNFSIDFLEINRWNKLKFIR